MSTLYVVTSGEYSDYGIEAIFSTRELAQSYIDATTSGDRWSQPGIEEWELDPGADDLRAGRKLWFVRMDRDGNVPEVRPDRGGSSDSHGFDAIGNMICTVWAADQEHAVKIVGERRARFLAEGGQWPPKRQ